MQRATHDGFWRPEVTGGHAIFHRQEDTKSTLKHLPFTRPSGLTAGEATNMLGRRFYRALQHLADKEEIYAADCQDTTIYVHRWPSLRDVQLAPRKTDQPTDVTPDEPAAEGML